jgi:hypothetical protein
LFKRWADAALQGRVEALEKELRLARVDLEALRLERDSLAAVVVRDRQRVAAETAESSRRIAQATGG